MPVPVQLRELVKQRLAVAAEEIFALVEKTLLEHDCQPDRPEDGVSETSLISPVPNLAIGDGFQEFQTLHNIKKEYEEVRITSLESAPPAGLAFPTNEDVEPEMELKIVEYHSEQCAADVSTQTDPKTEEKGPLPSSAALLSSPLLVTSSAPLICPTTEEKLCSLDTTLVPSKTKQVNPPKPFSCSVCSLPLVNRASLRRHSASHSAEELLKKRTERAALKKLHTCSVCRRAFCSPNGLKIHAKTHEKDDSRITRKAHQQQVKTKVTKELECRDLPEVGSLGKNILTKKSNMNYLESEEEPTVQELKDIQNVELPTFKTDNQSNKNKKSSEPQMLKDLKVAVYRLDSVEKLLPTMIENMLERRNCEVESQNTPTAEAIAPKSKEYRCMFCDEVYYTELSFRQHKFSHKNDFKCSICSQRFKRVHFLRLHIHQEHMTEDTANNKTLQSVISSKLFRTAKQFQIQKMMHGKLKFQHIPSQTRQFKCDICYKEFIHEELLMAHMKQHLEDGGHCIGEHGSCSLYKEGFSEEGFLAKQNLSHSEYTEENRREESSLRLEVKGILKERLEHQAPEEKEREGQNQSVEKQSSEKTSIETSTSGSSESDSSESESEECYKNEFPCPHCTEVLKSRPGFRRHQLSHKDDMTCPFCELRFKIKRERKQHIQTKHIKHREDGCGLKVVASGRLFHCKRCPRSFWNKKDVVAHWAFHKTKSASKKKLLQSSRSLFRCANCSRVFRLQSNWKKHLKEAHQTLSKPYRCSICPKQCLRWRRLWRHLKRHLAK